MDSIYKTIIDKGGDFGILCVFILILSVGLLKGLKSKNNPSLEVIVHFLRIVKYFCIISAIGIFVIKIIVLLDNSKTIDTLIKQKAQKIASDTLSVDSSSIEKTFQLSATAEMHFQGKGRLFATIKNEPSSTNQSTYDTILNVAIDDIKGFKLYNFENILVVSYNFDAPNDRILYAGQFKIPDFVEYVYTLNKKGFHMELGTSSFRVQTIIGFVIIFWG